jgi:aquaporin Z
MNRSVAQLIGTFWLVLGDCGSAVLAGGFASNGYGEHSPGGYSMLAALAIGMCQTLVHP